MSTLPRPATAADARNLAELAERTFRDTFGDVNSQDDMDAHCRLNFGHRRQLAEIEDDAWSTFVCEEGGQLIAYGQLRRSAAPPCVAAANPVEIYRLYVDRRWHGRGIAPMLMNALLADAREANADAVWLGVWERNPRAISFYRKAGFREVGEHRFMLGSDPQRDVVMSRPIDTG